MSVLNTQIKDDKGVAHSYATQLISFENGYPLQEELLAIVGDFSGKLFDVLKVPISGSVAAGVDAKSNGEDVDAGAVESFLDSEVTVDMLVGLNGTKGGEMIESFVRHIQKAGGMSFIKRLMAGTIRDNIAFNKEGAMDCYSGNWGEFYKAVFWVIKVNFGGALTGPFTSLSSLMPTLAPHSKS